MATDKRPWTATGLGWILAVLGLILTIVFFAIGRLDATHAILLALAFLAILL